MKIRRAKPSDARKISILRRKTLEKINSKDYTARQIEVLKKKNTPNRILDKIRNRHMFCIEDKGKILATIDLEGNKVGGLFVRYNFVRKGIGKKLLLFLENYAKKLGIKELKLYSTKTAYGFYLKYGYKLKKKVSWKTGSVRFIILKMKKRLR